jgi:hypothetical protein
MEHARAHLARADGFLLSVNSFLAKAIKWSSAEIFGRFEVYASVLIHPKSQLIEAVN